MGEIKVGSTDILEIYVGTTPVSEVYVGSTLIWSSGASTFTVTANFNTLSNSGGLGASVSFSYGVTDFSLTSQPSWVSSVTQTTSGGKTTGFTFDYDPNAGTSTRTGSITFFAAGASRSVSLTQAGTAVVSVTGVTLNTWSLNLTVGQTQTLTATVSPSNATNKSVTWSSSNTSVATVSQSGVVTAVSNGSARITVTTQDGNHTDYCDATVAALYLTVDTGQIEFDYDAYGSQSREAIVISSNQSWSAVASSGFAIDGSASGTNNGTIYVYPQSSNPSVNAKTGTVTITPSSGSAVTVQLSQGGLSAVSLSETQLNVSASSGNYSLTVYDFDNVGWLIESNQTWCTVSPSNGYGDTTLTVSVGQYTGTSSNRTATITLTPASGSAVTCTVTQAKASAVSVTPMSVTFDPAGSSVYLTVSGTFEEWYIQSSPTWCDMTGYGGNTSSIELEAPANTGSSTRTGTFVIDVDGTDFTITASQEAQSATNYTFSISATPSDATVTINNVQRTSYSCPAGTSITWSVAKSGYVTQSGTYTMGAEDHTETVTLTQEQTYTLSVSPNSLSFAYDTYSSATDANIGESIYIGGNDTWTLTKPSWCQVYYNTTSGTAPQYIRVYPNSANSGSSARTGTITITGTHGQTATVSVTQNYNTTALQGITVKCGAGTGDTDEVAMNDNCAFYEVYTPSGTTDTGVTWSIVSMTTPGSCTGQMIDYGGESYYTVTIDGSASIGDKIKVRATSTVNPSIYDDKEVTVTSDAGVIEDLPESVEIDYSDFTYNAGSYVYMGSSYQMQATVYPLTASQDVTWSLKKTNGSTWTDTTKVSITSSGLLTVNATSWTQVKVVATCVEDNSITDSLNMLVNSGT